MLMKETYPECQNKLIFLDLFFKGNIYAQMDV